jgi:hypothetical protein
VSDLHPQATHRAALPIREDTLVDICEMLGAERFELVDTSVTFFKRLPLGDGIRWVGAFGDHMVVSGNTWRTTSELKAETTLASVA